MGERETFREGRGAGWEAQERDAEGDPIATSARSWAHSAAREIIGDFLDRRGIKTELDGIDEDIRAEIVEMMELTILRHSRVEIAVDGLRRIAAVRGPEGDAARETLERMERPHA